MGIFENLFGGNSDELTGPPTPGTSPTPLSPQQYPTPSAMPFNIPVLGTILDTGRDLLVGPGNENLTTQEQVTRAILNTIILAKAPQALGDIHASNAARDRSSLAMLSDPQFHAYVNEYAKSMPEADAIRAASQKLRMPGGFDLPTTINDLPPVNTGEALKYGSQLQQASDVAGIMGTEKQPQVSPNIPDEQVQAARLRRIRGLPLMPGDDAILDIVDRRARSTIEGAGQEGYFSLNEQGQKVDAATGQVVDETRFPGSASSNQAPPGATQPTLGPPDQTPIPGQESSTRMLSEPELSTTTPSLDDNGIPFEEIVKGYNTATGKVTWGLRKIPESKREQLRQEAVARRVASEKNIDKLTNAQLNRTAGDVTEAKKIALRANAAIDELKKIAGVTGPDGFKGKNSIWSRYEGFAAPKGAGFLRNRFTEAEAKAYEWEQRYRSWNKNMAGNLDLGVYAGSEGPVATLIARIFGDTRLSNEDREVFKQALPTITDVGELAERKFEALPNLVQEIYTRSVEAQNTEQAELRGSQASSPSRPSAPTYQKGTPLHSTRSSRMDALRKAFEKPQKQKETE